VSAVEAVAGRGSAADHAVARAVALLAVLLPAAVLASILIGSRTVGPAVLLHSGGLGHALLVTRLPRTALGALVGAALALAGGCLQGITRNPLADPGLLGTDSGAALAVVLGLTYLGISSLSGEIWCALLGAALAAVLVYGVAAVGRHGATPAKLILAGAALAAGVDSWTSAVLITDQKGFSEYRAWQVGTIGGRGWDVVLTGLPFLAAGALLVLAGSRTLDALALGDDVARGLGRRVARDRLLLGLGAVLLAGTATALAGPIAFVGLVVPHAVRLIVGSSYARVLPLSIGYGAILVLAADVVGRVILPPTEVQVGIMTAVLGVPVFAWLLRRGRMASV
jgi:iron complex transport system permease protein